MMLNDTINGLFEMCGGILCWLTVRQIIKDKVVRGVWWPASFFWSAWGWWNLYYYPSLDQWMSFTGGAFLVLGNTTWIALVLYYRYVRGLK